MPTGAAGHTPAGKKAVASARKIGYNRADPMEKRDAAMAKIFDIADFSAPELDVYARLTENQLLNRADPQLSLIHI